MSSITVPSNPLNAFYNGDLQITDSGNPDLGTGNLYLTSTTSNFYVGGNTNLQQTLMTLNNGNFNITGSGGINSNITGATKFTSATTGNLFTTSVGSVTLSSSDGAAGSVVLSNAGPGANGMLLNATNTTSGQIALTSAGNSTTVTGIALSATGTTGGGISLTSACGNTTVKSIVVSATDGTNGSILVQGAGNFVASVPAVTVAATNTTSGQVFITSASNSTTVPAVNITGSSATGGNITISSAGPGTASGSIFLNASNSTSGIIALSAAGTSNSALNISTPNGGITSTSAGPVSITSSNTANGISIATGTAGVPVTIGTSTSVTTIVGSLNVLSGGSYTQIQSTNDYLYDNILTLNAGPAALALDSGLSVRRGQAPGATIVGDTVTQSGPVQESGTFQTGSATPATLVLSTFASTTNNFYNGWWITITSGTGINQTRRIKSYTASTKTAILYATADNTTTPLFADGLNLVTAPASGDTYQLWSESYETSTFSNTAGAFVWASSSVDPGQTAIARQQYTSMNHGQTSIYGKIYNNASFSAAGSTTIVVTLVNNGILSGDVVRISNSTAAGITAGVYTVTAVTANTFTFIAPSSITSTTASSLTVELLKTSRMNVNYLYPEDPYFTTVQIPGVFQTFSIQLVKTSSGTGAGVNLSALNQYGTYLVKVVNTSGTGASAMFSISNNATSVGSVNTLSADKGSTNERLSILWSSASTPLIYQSVGASSGTGSFTYSVIVY